MFSCYKTDVVQYQHWNLDPVTKVSGMQVNHVPRQYTVFYGNRFLSKHDETIWADTENYYSDFSDIKFGAFHSDHMFEAEFFEGSWKNFKILPFDNITISPACTTLHYGQTIFEGLKAYKNKEDEILIFRMDKNAKRFNISA